MGELAIQIFTDVAAEAVPFAVVWGLCSIIVRTFLKTAFGGRFEI